MVQTDRGRLFTALQQGGYRPVTHRSRVGPILRGVAAHPASRVRNLLGAAPKPQDFYELFRDAGANVERATALRPPARATTTQRAGGIRSSTTENGANIVVNATGSGFHDGPAVVCNDSWASSRPQTSHAQGSKLGSEGPHKDAAATSRQAATQGAIAASR